MYVQHYIMFYTTQQPLSWYMVVKQVFKNETTLPFVERVKLMNFYNYSISNFQRTLTYNIHLIFRIINDILRSH